MANNYNIHALNRGDLLSSLPTDNSNPTPSELIVLDKIFKRRSRENSENNSKKKCNNSFTVLLGGLLSAILSLPFIRNLLEKCGCNNTLAISAVHFIVFCIILFLIINQFN